MSVQQKTPRKVTVTPPDPKYTEKDIRKQHLRVAPYCRVSTGSEEQQTSFTAQMTDRKLTRTRHPWCGASSPGS